MISTSALTFLEILHVCFTIKTWKKHVWNAHLPYHVHGHLRLIVKSRSTWVSRYYNTVVYRVNCLSVSMIAYLVPIIPLKVLSAAPPATSVAFSPDYQSTLHHTKAFAHTTAFIILVRQLNITNCRTLSHRCFNWWTLLNNKIDNISKFLGEKLQTSF